MQSLLYPNSEEYQSQWGGYQGWYHGGQTHLGLSNATVAFGQHARNPVAKMTAGEDANESADDTGYEAQSNLVRFEIVRALKRHIHVGCHSDEKAIKGK